MAEEATKVGDATSRRAVDIQHFEDMDPANGCF